MTETPPPPPNEGRVLGLINAAKSLTLFNVLVIALLIALLIPVYIVWKTLSDPDGVLLDRFLSSYREIPSDSGCAIREVKERGGPERWSISSQWAAQGTDRWTVGVILTKQPTKQEEVSFCESLKLIAGQLVDHNGGDHDAPAGNQGG